jgi:tetratricopeptide (TPR) repeat protein
MRVFSLLILLVAANPALACLSFFDVPSPTPTPVVPPPVMDRLKNDHDRAYWQTRRADFEAQMAKGDFRTQNDLAVTLVQLGELKTALSYFKAIEINQPGLYHTAANLGTTYELLGDNKNALRWMREGLKRDAESHAGSEWIHLRILEAKLAGESSPPLEMDFGRGAYPSPPPSLPKNARGQAQTLEQIEESLIFQLHERLQFVPAPEPIVASLLFDLGNSVALRGEHSQAATLYHKALEFKPVNAALVQSRKEAAQGKMSPVMRGMWALLGLAALGGCRVWRRKSRENQARARVAFLNAEYADVGQKEYKVTVD